MNIIVQTTGIDESSLYDKIEIPKKSIANITRALILNPIRKKELWCFSYQYNILISCQTDDRLCGVVTCFLWHGTRPSYKHIKIWSVIVYIINGCVT